VRMQLLRRGCGDSRAETERTAGTIECRRRVESLGDHSAGERHLPGEDRYRCDDCDRDRGRLLVEPEQDRDRGREDHGSSDQSQHGDGARDELGTGYIKVASSVVLIPPPSAAASDDGVLARPPVRRAGRNRRQLIAYRFWFAPDGHPCGGCSMFTDQISRLAHLNARDTSLALVSRAPQPQIERLKSRMGWSIPWYTVLGEGFQTACGTTEYFALDVFLREGDRVFLTYATTGRGVEALGSVWTFLDPTPLGRQEQREDSPPGRPKTPPYAWWRTFDEYEPNPPTTR
jgi:Bacterial protein of unknown function (DUF899)